MLLYRFSISVSRYTFSQDLCVHFRFRRDPFLLNVEVVFMVNCLLFAEECTEYESKRSWEEQR